MGLLVSVYRTRGMDGTCNWLSHRADSLCLVNVPGPFDPDAQAPAAMLVKGNTPGTVKVVPAAHDGKDYCTASGWWMMGGNYAGSSDSRFTRAVEDLTGHAFYGAVAIHDRTE